MSTESIAGALERIRVNHNTPFPFLHNLQVNARMVEEGGNPVVRFDILTVVDWMAWKLYGFSRPDLLIDGQPNQTRIVARLYKVSDISPAGVDPSNASIDTDTLYLDWLEADLIATPALFDQSPILRAELDDPNPAITGLNLADSGWDSEVYYVTFTPHSELLTAYPDLTKRLGTRAELVTLPFVHPPPA